MSAPSLGILLSEVKKTRVQWASRGRIARGKLHTLEGNPGLGKSTLLTEWAARWSQGEPLPDGDPINERGVVMICAEDDPGDTIRPRFEAAGGDVDQVVILREIPYIDDDGKTQLRVFELPGDVETLEQVIKARNVGLVIIDPLAVFLADELSENSNKDVRKALTPLELMAQRTGASVILVRHLNKSSSTNALYRGGGSIGILAAARLGLLLEEDPRDNDIKCLARAKGNLGKEPATLQFRLVGVPGEEVARVEWLGESDLRAQDLLEGKITSGEQLDEWDEATVWLREYLSASPMPAKHVYRDAAIEKLSTAAIRKAKDRLRVRARKDGFGGGWLWELPNRAPVTVASNGHHPGEEEF